MAVTDFVRAYNSAIQSSSTNCTVTLPASPNTVVSGDELVIAICVNNSGGTFTAPSGWTLLHGGTLGSAKMFVYRATYGTDVSGTSFLFTNSTGSTWSWSIVATMGDVVGDFVTSNRGTVANGNPQSINSGNITPAVPVYMVATTTIRQAGNTPTSVPTTWPAGWTELDDDPGVITSATLVASSCAGFATAPTPAGTYSVTTTNNASISLGSGLTAIIAYEGGPPAFSDTLATSGSGSNSFGGNLPKVSGSLATSGSGTSSFTGKVIGPPLLTSGSGSSSFGGTPKTVGTLATSGSGTNTWQPVGGSGLLTTSGSGTLTFPTRLAGLRGVLATTGSGTSVFAPTTFRTTGSLATTGQGTANFTQVFMSARGSLARTGLGTAIFSFAALSAKLQAWDPTANGGLGAWRPVIVRGYDSENGWRLVAGRRWKAGAWV